MAPLASAYSGPPKLTLGRAFTEWRLDVPMLVLIVAALAWYLYSAAKVRRGGGQWGTGRSFAFVVLGLGFWAIATMAWPGVYESVLFYARATQTVLLVLVAPLFLAMGKPLTLLIETSPAVGRRVERAVRSFPAKVLTFPAITTLLLVAVPMSMYFTSWYSNVFSSGALREVTYLILMVPGYVFFWTLLRVDPVPREYPYLVAMWITAAEVVGDAFFGIAIIADQTILGAAHYHAVGYPFGPSLATSQVLGGGIIWILGDAVGLPFLAIQLIQLMREDKAEAAAIDAELDAKDAARNAAGSERAAAADSTKAAPAPPSSTPTVPATATASSTPTVSAAASSTPAASAPPTASSTPAASAAATANSTATVGAEPAPAGATATSEPDEIDEADEVDRPWWETDPSLTNRFRQA